MYVCMYYVRIMYCECMYVFIYLIICADMCAWTRIRRMSVTGRRVFGHSELLTNWNTTVQSTYASEFQLSRTFHSYCTRDRRHFPKIKREYRSIEIVIAYVKLLSRLHKSISRKNTIVTSGVPRNFFRGGSTYSVEDRGQRGRGSGGGSPLARGSEGSCNLVQKISFHIVKFS